METTYNYSNVQKAGGRSHKTVKKVIIKNGKGHKSVSHYKNGKLCKTKKRKLTNEEILLIKNGKFIPGLFNNCICNKTKALRNKK